jgi:hypothetical protein
MVIVSKGMPISDAPSFIQRREQLFLGVIKFPVL